jgi:hypothetical protein
VEVHDHSKPDLWRRVNPTTTSPQPSGGASSISYRKRRTRSLQPRGAPSDPAHDHDLTRQAATAAAVGAPSRVQAEPLKTSTHHNAGRSVSQDRCRTLLFKGVHPEGYEGGDASSSPLTTGTCPRSLWRRNDAEQPRTTEERHE